MLKLAIFDFDNTILDLGVDWGAVRHDVADVAEKAGVAVDRSMYLVTMANTLSEKHGLKKEVDAVFLRHEMECAKSKSYVPFQAMFALVRELRSKGIKTAISSGNHTESIREILSQVGMLGEFDIVCGRDAVLHNKPAPDQVLWIMEKLKATAKDTVFIGDSINDEQAAKAAGVRHIHVERGKDNAPMIRKLLL